MTRAAITTASRSLLGAVRAEIESTSPMRFATHSRTGQSATASRGTDSFSITPETRGFRVSVYRDAHPEMFSMTNRDTISGCVRWAMERLGIIATGE